MHRGEQSYADVVRRSPQEHRKGTVITTQHLVLPWMVNSVVGHLPSGVSFDQLYDEFVKGGINEVKVRYMGDRKVLLTLEGEEGMENLIKHNKD